MKNALQLAIVLSTMVLSFGGVFLMANAGKHLGTANVLEVGVQLENYSVPVGYETRLLKGDQLMQTGQYSMAASEYALAIELQKENPEAYSRLGAAYTKLQQWEKAELTLEQAVVLAPQKESLVVEYALALTRNKKFQEARSVLEDLEESQMSLFYLSVLESYYGDYDDAQKHLNGAAEMAGKLSKKTIESLQSAYARFNAQQAGQFIYLKALLAESFIDMELYPLAEELSLEVLNENKDYRDVWILLGYAQLKTQAYQEAEDAFKQAKRLDAVKPEIYYFLGNAHYFQEEYTEAAAAYELALLYGFQPEVEVYSKIAESYLFLGNYEEALVAYEHLIKINPDNIDTFIRPIWIALTQLRDLDRALSLSQSAVEQFPNQAMSHNLLGWTHLERGEWEEAEISIDKALKLDPNLAEAHYNKGLISEQKEDEEGALNSFKNAEALAEESNPIKEMAKQKVLHFESLTNPE